MSRIPPIKVRGQYLSKRIAKTLYVCTSCKASIGVQHPSALRAPTLMACPDCGSFAGVVAGVDERLFEAQFVVVKDGKRFQVKRLEA